MTAPVFHTLGCRLNAAETEAMKRLVAEAGVERAVIVNTCAVTQEAVREARQVIRRLARENPGATIVVTGCAAQTEPETFAAMPEVTHVVGNAEKLRPETWARFAPNFLGEVERVQVDDIFSVRETALHLVDGFGTRARAFVQVQNGCDHRCTFCIIPYGRGNARSVPAGAVVEQIRRLVDRGYQEVVLTGVDLTAWGSDLPGAPRLGGLVQRILRLVPDLPRLRLSSIDGVEADPELRDVLKSEPRLMPHVHLSLQSGDDLILKRMKRRHRRADAVALCAELRAARPEIVFGADLIAGFPTETDAAFENTLTLIAECGLTWLHVFPFSPRPGTPAARMPQVPQAVIRARAKALREAGAKAALAYLSAELGRPQKVLIETPRLGRTEGFAEVVFATEQLVGKIISVVPKAVEDGRLVA